MHFVKTMLRYFSHFFVMVSSEVLLTKTKLQTKIYFDGQMSHLVQPLNLLVLTLKKTIDIQRVTPQIRFGKSVAKQKLLYLEDFFNVVFVWN